MILLRIVSTSETEIERIAEILLKENMAIDLNLQRDLERMSLVSGEMKSSKVFRLTAKTKAMLFSKIDKRLNEAFPENLPEVHALAIVEMDWSQAESLKQSLHD